MVKCLTTLIGGEGIDHWEIVQQWTGQQFTKTRIVLNYRISILFG